MKAKLNDLRAGIKAKLDAAAKAITESKLEEAKILQAEAATLKEQADLVKTQIDAETVLETDTLKARIAELEVKAKEPIRPPFETEEKVEPESDELKSVYLVKYGEPEAAVKAVIAGMYGSDFNYNQRRHEQMVAFMKYVRFGEYRLNAKEQELLKPSWKNIILSPDLIKAEIIGGRSVAELKATLEEGSGDLGGNLVPEDYRAEIIRRLKGNTVVRGRARVVTTTRDAIEWPRLEGGNTLYTSAVRETMVDETPTNASAAETNPTFGLIRIPVHTGMTRTNLSRNLLEDSAFNLLDTMAELFAEAMAINEDALFLTGQGGNGPRGPLGARANGNQASPITGVTNVVSGNATQITADGIVDLVYAIASQYRASAIHVMARTVQRDVRKLKDGDGRYMWQPGIVAGQPPTLLGFPVLESESMDTIAANARVDLYGDWRAGYILVDRVGMTIERVSDSTTVGQNQVALFGRRRYGGDCVGPWAFAALQIST